MRKLLLLFAPVAIFVASLQSCKPDPPVTPPDNTDPDSLYVGTSYILEKPFQFPTITSVAAQGMTYEGVELGRRLFYDKHLSSTGQLSCASCHKQEFAFSDGGLAKSTNVFGPTRRNTPGIINMIWVKKPFWDGRVDSLAAQAKDAFHGEQDLNIPNAITYLKADSTYVRLFKKAYGRPGDITEDRIYNAIQQFMATLISSNSRFDRVRKGLESFTASEEEGFQIFATERGDCFHCHTDGVSLLFTSNFFQNNGLDTATTKTGFLDGGRGEITAKTEDYGKFRTPSLRNVALTAPYMHDGRYNTLEQVINFYSDSAHYSYSVDPIMLKPNHAGGGLHLTTEEKQALLDFMLMLTDTSFTNNPAFADPF